MLKTKEVFNKYNDQSFPSQKKKKCCHSPKLCRDRIVSCLQDGSNENDKNFCQLVKKSSFQLLDPPEAGLRDVLVVKISEEK